MTFRIALVLGSGGTPGTNWMRQRLGELQASTGFESRHATTIIGTSAGSVVGAEALPFVPPPQSVIDELLKLGEPLPHSPTSAWAYWLRRVLGIAASVVARTILRRKATHSSLDWVKGEASHEGFRSVATTWFGRRRIGNPVAGDSKLEVAASAAVPLHDVPVEIDSKKLLDGAIWSATNADLINPAEFDYLILMAPHVTTDAPTLSFTGLHRVQLTNELKAWRNSRKPVLSFVPTLEQYRNR